MRFRLAMILLASFALAGCSTAGPFVTNISSDGRGNLVVEKNIVHYNNFTGIISTGDHPMTQTIRVYPVMN